MTENTTPAPQHPAPAPAPEVVGQPAAYPLQAPGQYAQPYPVRPKSSGYRVAAGILGIVLGAALLLPTAVAFGFGGPVIGFLVLIAALGNITAGIVLLANQRNRKRGAPVTALSFAGLTVALGLLDVVLPFSGPDLVLSALFLAVPVLIVMGLGLSKEKRAA